MFLAYALCAERFCIMITFKGMKSVLDTAVSAAIVVAVVATAVVVAKKF